MSDESMTENVTMRCQLSLVDAIDSFRSRCRDLTGFEPSRSEVVRLAVQELIADRGQRDDGRFVTG